MKEPKAILFDLDGTLLDTASDLTAALNDVLAEEGLPLQDPAKTKMAAGEGSRGLLKLGLGLSEKDPRWPDYIRKFLKYYEAHLLDETRFFQGVETLLAHVDQEKIPWGIVTNKPAQYTDKITQAFHLNRRAACIISGDTIKERKPQPEPLLLAAKLMDMQPSHCFYVGDSLVDIQASEASGMKMILARYGYLSGIENKTYKLHASIDQAIDLLLYL